MACKKYILHNVYSQFQESLTDIIFCLGVDLTLFLRQNLFPTNSATFTELSQILGFDRVVKSELFNSKTIVRLF